jgi:predicted nucleic acid-binding protein
MPKTIISDTSCFIILSNIGELNLLHKVYHSIITTAEVANEFGEPLPDWVEIRSVANVHYQQILELQIDKGEASAMPLQLKPPIVSL